jgi:hypothetical protein
MASCSDNAGEEVSEERKESIDGAAFDAHETLGANHVHFQLCKWGEHGVVPDCVEDDVGDRVISRTNAVTGM